MFLLPDESPYFIHKHNRSNASNALSESSLHIGPGNDFYGTSLAGVPHSASRGGSADDFRSVIDDLTIQNRKLKERLRKYEAMHSEHLEKDKLFEVKVHGLPAKEKRELEETLRIFAARIGSSSGSSAKPLSRGAHHHFFPITSKNTSMSSSMSRPADSAYASMSISGPTSSSILNRAGVDGVMPNKNCKEQNVESFLPNIPEGLLSKHSSAMTERQKQKIVVRRLEQLFTGKKGSAFGERSQPLQQQELSKSAALADQAANAKWPSAEGVREAHILPYEMEVDSKTPIKAADDSSNETDNTKGFPDGATATSLDSHSLEQRPTRPLDLDPDRAQIPSDNVEYIRHLATPSFQTWNSGDAEPENDGWIYLNLLISMAQLHMINVTPNFVRSAVAEVSDRFQLSRDGRKIRWRGGTEGTRMSRDSSTGSVQTRSPLESDSLDESCQKRRKLDVGKFASIPFGTTKPKAPEETMQAHPLHYKPLFHHRRSSSEDMTSNSESEPSLGFGHGYENASATGGVSRTPRLRSRGSHSMSGGRERRHDHGPIVFYSGAQFCTDLSGDRGCITTPLHETGVGKDGYSNHNSDVVGCGSRADAPTISRTPSGSLLQFRPFKDYSKGPDPFQANETRAKSPDLIADDPSDLDFSLEWSCQSAPAAPLINFSASGLGGTQPADHFAVQVETRRTIFDDRAQGKLSKFSAPRPGTRKKFVHTIPKSALESFKESQLATPDDLSASLASLFARSPSPKAQAVANLPVQTEIVSAKFAMLEPSILPAPLGYYTAQSSSDSDSDCSSSSSYSGISHLRRAPRSFKLAFVQSPASASAPQDLMEGVQESGEMQDSEDDEEDYDSDDSDESIDLLASARQADPETIAEREEEFEMQTDLRLTEELLAGSIAATGDGGSGTSSAASESSGDMESD